MSFEPQPRVSSSIFNREGQGYGAALSPTPPTLEEPITEQGVSPTTYPAGLTVAALLARGRHGAAQHAKTADEKRVIREAEMQAISTVHGILTETEAELALRRDALSAQAEEAGEAGTYAERVCEEAQHTYDRALQSFYAARALLGRNRDEQLQLNNSTVLTRLEARWTQTDQEKQEAIAAQETLKDEEERNRMTQIELEDASITSLRDENTGYGAQRNTWQDIKMRLIRATAGDEFEQKYVEMLIDVDHKGQKGRIELDTIDPSDTEALEQAETAIEARRRLYKAFRAAQIGFAPGEDIKTLFDTNRPAWRSGATNYIGEVTVPDLDDAIRENETEVSRHEAQKEEIVKRSKTVVEQILGRIRGIQDDYANRFQAISREIEAEKKRVVEEGIRLQTEEIELVRRVQTDQRVMEKSGTELNRAKSQAGLTQDHLGRVVDDIVRLPVAPTLGETIDQAKQTAAKGGGDFIPRTVSVEEARRTAELAGQGKARAVLLGANDETAVADTQVLSTLGQNVHEAMESPGSVTRSSQPRQPKNVHQGVPVSTRIRVLRDSLGLRK